MIRIGPCRDAGELRGYIDAHWRAGHVLARDGRMFDFQYRTPWVNREAFPEGISVLCAHDEGRLVGFLGAITAPYPRLRAEGAGDTGGRSYWLALWHVLPDLKGGGVGGKLLRAMQEIALGEDGWIGTFGAGPEAVPVYLKRGFCVRGVRRWVYGGDEAGGEGGERSVRGHTLEGAADAEWVRYRFERHPVFTYEVRDGGVFRTETNEWGVVTHALRLGRGGAADVEAVYRQERARADEAGANYLMDAWGFEAPGGGGAGWALASEELPSVFRPPMARGNIIYAAGKPFMPGEVQKGDCDQDRPN